MFVNTVYKKASRSLGASVALALAVVVSACGATAAQQSLGAQSDLASDSAGSATQAVVSAGSFSLDYDTVQHMGTVQVGAGSFSLDYNTAAHLGRLSEGAGSFSLDYDTARHVARSGASTVAP